MIDRTALSIQFLSQAGWADASRNFLAGDASDRRYDRLSQGQKTAVLMDAPPGKGDDPAVFVTIAQHLASLGLSAPKIIAQDTALGFLLIEDLGDDLFARLIADDPAMEHQLYAAATDVLIHLQAHPPSPNLPDLSALDWAKAAGFALEWYRFGIVGAQCDTSAFTTCLCRLIDIHANGSRIMILRDYHAENLLWLPTRAGLGCVGLLDFQLAQMGQPGYDLVSLLQDARRDVSPGTEHAMIARFVAKASTDPELFRAAYATLGAQRALRIIGVFARLCLHGGKPGYLAMIPRVWGQLQRSLAHPALAELRAICDALLPEPSPENLARIGAQCGMIHNP